MIRKYTIYPCNPGSAHANGCKQCRNKGNPETTEITGHDLIKQTENVSGKNNDQSGITDRRAVGTYRGNGNSTVRTGKISHDGNIRCIKKLLQDSGSSNRNGKYLLTMIIYS